MDKLVNLYPFPMERSVTPTAANSDGRKAEYIELFDMLNEEQQAFIIASIKGLLAVQ